jgi:hypothetical protein
MGGVLHYSPEVRLDLCLSIRISETWNILKHVARYSVASTYGLFNSAAFDFRFSVFEDEQFQQSLPPPLWCLLTIQRFCGRACRSIFDSPIGLSGPRALRVDALIDGLEIELEKIQEDLSGHMSGEFHVSFTAFTSFSMPIRLVRHHRVILSSCEVVPADSAILWRRSARRLPPTRGPQGLHGGGGLCQSHDGRRSHNSLVGLYSQLPVPYAFQCHLRHMESLDLFIS